MEREREMWTVWEEGRREGREARDGEKGDYKKGGTEKERVSMYCFIVQFQPDVYVCGF